MQNFSSLQEKFHLKHNLTGVFIDSYAFYKPEDAGEQVLHVPF